MSAGALGHISFLCLKVQVICIDGLLEWRMAYGVSYALLLRWEIALGKIRYSSPSFLVGLQLCNWIFATQRKILYVDKISSADIFRALSSIIRVLVP